MRTITSLALAAALALVAPFALGQDLPHARRGTAPDAVTDTGAVIDGASSTPAQQRSAIDRTTDLRPGETPQSAMHATSHRGGGPVARHRGRHHPRVNRTNPGSPSATFGP